MKGGEDGRKGGREQGREGVFQKDLGDSQNRIAK